MAAINASVYEKFIIESVDGSKNVDVSRGVITFAYYEDIFSPTVTAKVIITNDGNTIKGPDGEMTSLYNGLPIRGGERVIIKIAGNSKNNPGIDFSEDISKYFYVSSIKNVIQNTKSESFVLDLVPRETITNETSRVGRKYPASTSISDSVKDIVKKYLKTDKLKDINVDKTQNPYGFLGNLRKPFTVLTWLASKSVPGEVSGKDATAGYLFFETVDGYHFISIDSLIAGNPHEDTYVYTEVTKSEMSDNDFKILQYTTNKNQDLLSNLKRGAYCSHRIFFNPLNFTYTNPEKGLFKMENYVGKTENLGKDIDLPSIGDDSGKTLGDIPSRNITAVMDIGTLEKNASVKDNADPTKIFSQAMMRYNTTLTQTMSLTIPSNTNLRAGDIIKCQFPRIDRSEKSDKDEEQSGLYMIKELCHFFDSSGSYTSLKLLRDTFGRKEK
tara:strand:+ start:1740 stop:3065 length:1326 start_codon:yes stop_codon:yes gene_type:complete